MAEQHGGAYCPPAAVGQTLTVSVLQIHAPVTTDVLMSFPRLTRSLGWRLRGSKVPTVVSRAVTIACCVFVSPEGVNGQSEAFSPRTHVMEALAACVDNRSLGDVPSVGRILSENGNETIATIIEVTFPGTLDTFSTNSVGDLLRDLGAADYRDRDATSQRLVKLGRGILPYVKPLLSSDDPELRFRAARICEFLERRMQPLLRDRTRTLDAFHELVWRTMPLDAMRAGVKAHFAALGRAGALHNTREQDILGVLLASMRYSPDQEDHHALLGFARTASDAPASIAIRVMQGGLLHALDPRSADRWLTLPALAPFDMAELLDPKRPESYRSILACDASATVLAKVRDDAMGGALAKDRALLRDVNAHLLQEYGDDAARQFFLSQIQSSDQAEDALIQLFAREGPSAAVVTDTQEVRGDMRLDALWASLFQQKTQPAPDPTAACLYVWVGAAPVEYPWYVHLTLAPQDHQVTAGKEMVPVDRPTSYFRVERFDSVPTGRYELKLDDGSTCLRRGVFLTPGVNVALLPPLRIVGEDVHFPLPAQDSARLEWRYGFGAITNDMCASVRFEEIDGRFAFSGYRALNGRIRFHRLPEATYKVSVSIESSQLRVATDPSSLLLRLPPLRAGALQFPFRSIAGSLNPVPTGDVPVSVTFRTRLFTDDDGAVRAIWNTSSNHWRDAHITITAPVSDGGAFSVPLFPDDWLAICDTKGIIMEQPVRLQQGIGTIALHAQRRNQFRLQVNVSDADDGSPLNTGQIFACVPVSHVSAIDGFVNEQDIRGGIATFEPRDACNGYALYARSPGYMNSLPEFFALNRDTRIEITLQKSGATLTGRIINILTGESVADVPTIGLYYRDAEDCMLLDYYDFDQKDRCFRVSGLRPGQYDVHLWGYDVLSGANFQIADGETQREIELLVRPPK